MYWKNRWNNVNIKKKVFFITIAIITITSLLAYILLYFLLPQFYNIYRTYKVNSEILNTVKTLENNKDIDIDNLLDNFTYKNNAMVLLKTIDGEIIYSSNKGLSKKEPMHEISEFEDEISEESDKLDKREERPKKKSHSMLQVEKNFNLKKLNMECVLIIIYSPMTSVREMSKMILLFLPFMVIITLIIGILASVIYSKIMASPLIRINNISKKIAKLDFTDKLDYKGNDEIAQLSTSINEMSYNLQKSIEELANTNIQLKNDIEKERQLEKRRREFLTTISHELKSPITIIRGQVEGMIYNIGPFKDRDKYLKQCLSTLDQLKELVGEILLLSKYENYDFKLNIERINLTLLIKDIVKNQKFFIDEKDISTIINLENEIFVYGDKKLIEKALTNIINNGIKYSKPKEKLILNLKRNSNCAELIIKNTGAHIEIEEIEQVFKAFYRIEKSRNRKTGGSGLGLYIVKTIFDMHRKIQYFLTSENNYVKFKIIFQD